jgi:long-subunit fatty acid transport protein
VPFGLITDYGSGFAGRYFANNSEVTTLTFQPSVRYAFNDKVSIGFGPTINRISGELSAMVLNVFSPGTNDGNVKSRGADTALGFNAGILVQATDSTRLGITYYSKVSYSLDAKTKVTGGSFGVVAEAYLTLGQFSVSGNTDGLVLRAVGDRMVIAPPFCLTHAEADELIEKVQRVIELTYAHARGLGLIA